MTNRTLLPALALVLASAQFGCVPPQSGGGTSGGSERRVNPNACGAIDTTDTGRKLMAFLDATARLEAEVDSLDDKTRKACTGIGSAIGLADAQLTGSTKELCDGVNVELKRQIDGAFAPGSIFVVTTVPATCTVNADVAAQVSAECEAKAKAEMQVTCQGSCTGTCNGTCKGTCAAKNADGSCAGACDGECDGRCEGECAGTADVQADAQCKASGEVRASVDATCTPAKVTVTPGSGGIKDPAAVQKIAAALEVGLPALLDVAAQLNGPLAGAFVSWRVASNELSRESSRLANAFGSASLCVAGQISNALGAMSRIEVKMSAAIEASASIGGTAGTK